MGAIQVDDALIGEMYEVLNSAESFISRLRSGPECRQIIDAIIRLRANLVKECPAARVYSAAQLMAVFENALDAIVVIDEGSVITFFNISAERLFGYSASEIVGQKVNALMPSPFREQHDEYLARFLQTREAKVIGFGREVLGRHKDGFTFPVHLTLSHARVGSLDMFSGFLREIRRPSLDGVSQNQKQPRELILTD